MNNRRRMIEQARKRQPPSLTGTLALGGIAAEINRIVIDALKATAECLLQVMQAIDWDGLQHALGEMKLKSADTERCNK